MLTLPFHGDGLIKRLEADLAAAGMSHALSAARGLARDGLPLDVIDFMLRGLFPKPVLVALIEEAKAHTRASEPVIR